MGVAIAANLLAAGHSLTVYNRTREKAKPLLSQGAMLAHEPAGTASGDIVITMLADDRAVEQIVFGPAGSEDQSLIVHQGKDTIHISMSTISARLSHRIAETSKNLGRSFISATVMGRPDVAERGELIVMTAGDSSSIEKCKKLFEPIAKSVHIVGEEPEQANVIKLAANFMLSSMIETFSEAFALVRKNGIDHHQFMQIMAKDFFQSPVYEKYGKLIASEKFDSGAFTVHLQEKDTRLALNAAIESEVPMPFVSVLENTFLTAIGRGKGDLDPCSIVEVALENAGITTSSNKKIPT
jgi:3-hydroxyisobutyrate dehydrogenase-like beta-hydroxyacid dehydrogenase